MKPKKMCRGTNLFRLVLTFGFCPLLAGLSGAAHINTHTNAKSKPQKVSENQFTRRHYRHLAHSRNTTAQHPLSTMTHGRYGERFHMSSFAEGVTNGDITIGEDLSVRQAALDALGNMNGTVVAIAPSNGRILAMVNQRLALSHGAQPCSTIKLVVALAALNEGLISKNKEVPLGGRFHVNLTTALAYSNNAYFEALGRELGFEKVARYAREYGLGELAGYHIPGEQVGGYPDAVIPKSLGGIGKMCSFGEGVSMTPLQLGAIVSAIANGGTLYYLQHPTTPKEIASFQPRVKRQLDIAPIIPELSEGMAGAVQYGTARSLNVNFTEEEILGKTGTCSHKGTRYGWFASYANTSVGRVVVVIFLQGGRPTFGPKAAEIAGRMYRKMYDDGFFVAGRRLPSDAATVKTVGTSPQDLPNR